MEVGQFYSSVKLYVYICTYWLRLTGYVTVMTPMRYVDNHHMLRFLPCGGLKWKTQISKLLFLEMDKLDNMHSQNVRFMKWCNVGLALQHVTVLMPFIDFIPPPVYFVGVLNDHCQILIDVVQFSDKHNKAIRLNFCVLYFYTT